jgi:hypothetical protein
MANNTLYFKNPNTGETRKAPVGYSWTVLIFSFFTPILRSDYKWAVIIFITHCLAVVIAELFAPRPDVVVFYIALLVSFFYNNMYIKELVKKGFHVYKAEKGELSEVLNIYKSKNLGADFEIPIMENENTNQQLETDKVIQQTNNEDKTMSTEEKINSLNNLKEKNLISNDEYNEKKKQILDKI